MTDRTLRTPADLDGLLLDGPTALVPVVAQDAATGAVLMLAWANREALERTLETREVHFFSRSRGTLWRKGETSGHVLRLVSLHADCDGDALLARVHPVGPACHTGERSCFGAGTEPAGEAGAAPDAPVVVAAGAAAPGSMLRELWDVVDARARELPDGSYTTRLLRDENLRLKKLGEETAELLVALTRGERERIPEEAADLLYHVLVAVRAAGGTLVEVEAALAGRRGTGA